MSALELTAGEYADLVRSPLAHERAADPSTPAVWIVHGEDDPDLPLPGNLPVVVTWCGERFGGYGPGAADLVLADCDLDEIVSSVGAAPVAARSLVVLLRSQPDTHLDAALAAESAVYSALQAGPEFTAWRASRAVPAIDTHSPVVHLDRTDDELTITLDRPECHNAIGHQLREELIDALVLAALDRSLRTVHLRGRGPSFSSGGDLREFGAFADPASAHVTRLTRSPARLAAVISDRLRVEVHGATLGGGLELAAFASEVVADPDVSIGLPELAIGLIPGAGGTVSVLARIGRQRTAALALSGRRVGASLAHEWGLVDSISPPTK